LSYFCFSPVLTAKAAGNAITGTSIDEYF